ncbi:MAG: uL14 family ribosomal protein, partial [Cytophagales bacterium]|nr:uL14 family ribosomal protein [Cytophagales bacterium]
MIRQESRLQVADNSGASVVSCVRILDSSMQKSAAIGDRIVVTVKKIDKVGGVKCGDVSKAVIVRTKKEVRRED